MDKCKKIKDNWQDLGYVNTVYDKDTEITLICQRCKQALRIGKEDNKTFRYCPRCLEKITDYETSKLTTTQ